MQRMFKFLFFLCISGILFSCTSAEFIKTGNEFSPLGDNEEIEVFNNIKPAQKYQEIGLLRVRGGKTEKRIEDAKNYARKKGGNGIVVREIGILTEPGTENVAEKVENTTYDTQEFVIIKLEGDKIASRQDTIEGSQAITTGIPVLNPDKIPSFDYSIIPRATYKQLINDYKSLQGKMFQGSLYPKKMYKIPSSLKDNTEAGDRLILLTTKTGKNNVYIIANKENIPLFKEKIKSGEILNFIYSPVQVYTTKAGDQPVIKFIEEIVKSK
ncbi:MAG: hypothetical protein V1874_03940 [Spirochaetota bacterium]